MIVPSAIHGICLLLRDPAQLREQFVLAVVAAVRRVLAELDLIRLFGPDHEYRAPIPSARATASSNSFVG